MKVNDDVFAKCVQQATKSAAGAIEQLTGETLSVAHYQLLEDGIEKTLDDILEEEE